MASPAPLRMLTPSRSTPLIRVVAEKGTNAQEWMSGSSAMPKRRARATIERPSGVSSATLARSAALTSRCISTPGAGMNSAAWRLPRVMVPVLSRRRTSTSPEASTARPDIASTFFWSRRSMPAMPIAERRAPMVVGMRQTSSAISTTTDTEAPEKTAKGCRVTTAMMKMMVRLASRMLRAISLGVFCREADSTSPMIRSMKVSPGFWVISMTIRSLSTRVPPVTALRSPPASRITGADSPVIADSSTEAIPSTMVPSLGMMSPVSQTTMSPRRSSGAGTPSSVP